MCTGSRFSSHPHRGYAHVPSGIFGVYGDFFLTYKNPGIGYAIQKKLPTLLITTERTMTTVNT